MRLTLIDLSSLAFPIWHMSQSDPNPNVVADQLVARVRGLGDDHTAIACDSGKSFRNEVSADYKANRKPEERATLYHQIDLALERLRGDGFPIWSATGFEADDVIASAVNRAAADGHDVVIVSADKDLLQLVTDAEAGVGSVQAKSIKTGDLIDEAAVEARFGVKPSQMRDYLTIVGDASDNVKGVAGIGEKGAAAVLQKYGSLDIVYAEIDQDPLGTALKPSQVLALQAFRSRLPEVRTLITLRTDADIPFEQILAPRVPNDVPPLTEEEPVPDEDVFIVPADDLDDALPTIPVSAPPPDPAPDPPRAAVASPDPAGPSTQAPPVKKPTPGVLTVVPNGQPVDWKAQLEPTSMSEAIRLADLAFHSKQFSAYGTPQAVLMSLLAGRELGLTAMASLRALHILEGKPTMSADLMRALVIKSGAVNYFRCVERTNEKATWEAQRGNDPPVTLTFTMDDARQAGVVKPNSGWVKFPSDMLTARASSKLARLIAPDVIHGVYLPEEIRENS
jgi:5'-3' exonuclease